MRTKHNEKLLCRGAETAERVVDGMHYPTDPKSVAPRPFYDVSEIDHFFSYHELSQGLDTCK